MFGGMGGMTADQYHLYLKVGKVVDSFECDCGAMPIEWTHIEDRYLDNSRRVDKTPLENVEWECINYYYL